MLDNLLTPSYTYRYRRAAMWFLARTIRIEFSEQDLKKIQHLRYEYPHPKVRRRTQVPWLKSQGLAHRGIFRLAGVSSNTLRQYLGMFQSGGIKKLTEFNFYVPTSELERHRYRLEAHFREHPPATINEAAAKIQEVTGIKRSRSAVGRFLNSLGMAPRRVGTMPAQTEPEKQERYRTNELEPRFEKAMQGRRPTILCKLLTSYWVPFSSEMQ
jgi:transposase